MSKNLISMIFFFLCCFCSFGKAKGPKHCSIVDGPANLRDAPNGKLILELPQNASVTELERKGSWSKVRTVKSTKGTYTCWYDDFDPPEIIGWTHQKNLKNLGSLELAKLDACTLDSSTPKSNFLTATVKGTECTCANWQNHGHAAPTCDIHVFKSKEKIGAECVDNGDVLTCYHAFIDSDGSESYTCPRTCLKTQKSNILNFDSKIQIVKDSAINQRLVYNKLLPPGLIDALNGKYPKWIPYLKDRNRNSDYELDLVPGDFFLKLESGSVSKKKPLWIVLFYESPPNLLSLTLSWGFYQEESKRFWSGPAGIPLRLKEYFYDETRFCAISETVGPRAESLLVADIMIDEWHRPQGVFLLNDVFEKGPIRYSELDAIDQATIQGVQASDKLMQQHFGIEKFSEFPSRIGIQCLPFSKGKE